MAWRTPEREIARGVTLHNMGLALRRLANLAPERSAASLEASAAALGEAAEIRARHNLAEGHALSVFHLALTLEQAGRDADARKAFERAAMAFQRLGKRDSAAIAAGRAASL